ncbi:hypothetical protein I302_103174 [Kwoniella bestiolae CBS 10118]|uniref:Uncharacterized protein n=1 Tax=Kwoniella bestiolae CBS 10118 TaxID=1296100 RepID=A0A1B9G7M4_9TREE|nr:hypothetical protein I302_01872 [Kwoniella bestiolae CBS 10118]OCF27037.1 hypothetical protein I302_01872 [Kwoniella bestiolae CBS 10118]
MSSSGTGTTLSEVNLQAFLTGKVEKLQAPRTIYYMSQGTLSVAKTAFDASGTIPWVWEGKKNGSISWKLIAKTDNLPDLDTAEAGSVIVSWKSSSNSHASSPKGLLTCGDLEMLSDNPPEESVCRLSNPMWTEILSDVRTKSSKLSDENATPQSSCSQRTLRPAFKQARAGGSASKSKVVS